MDLLKAIKKQNIEKIKSILSSRNIDVDFKRNGQTPLHVAAVTGNAEIMKIILDLGPDVNIKSSDFHHKTPLHLACKYASVEVIELLLRSGADVNSTDRYGNTPLHKASAKGMCDVVKLLLSKNAILSATNSNNTSALHVAALNGDTDVVKVLLQCGIDKIIKNKSGETAQSYAMKNKHFEIAEFIKTFSHVDFLKRSECFSPILLDENHNNVKVNSWYDIRKNDLKALDKRLKELQQLKSEVQQLFASDGIRLKKAQENLMLAQTRYNFTNEKLKELEDELSTLTEDRSSLNKELSDLEIEENNNNNKMDERHLYECPICFEVPLPPLHVYQCHQGHIYCERCKRESTMEYCPQCRQSMGGLSIRCRHMEDLIFKKYS